MGGKQQRKFEVKLDKMQKIWFFLKHQFLQPYGYWSVNSASFACVPADACVRACSWESVSQAT